MYRFRWENDLHNQPYWLKVQGQERVIRYRFTTTPLIITCNIPVEVDLSQCMHEGYSLNILPTYSQWARSSKEDTNFLGKMMELHGITSNQPRTRNCGLGIILLGNLPTMTPVSHV